MDQDITLTFDSHSFLKAIQQVGESMTAATNKFTTFTKSTDQKTDNTLKNQSSAFSSFVVAKGMLLAGLLKGAFNKVVAQLPEVQRAFSIAGDIVMKNLLWPLRKELVPVLQKMLDWVRDNRAMFVQWGNVLVNIFRAIKTIVLSFIDLLKGIWERLSTGLERIFGKTAMTIQEILNLIIFKITALVLFLKVLLEPIFKFIVDMFLIMAKNAEAFFSAFLQGFGSLRPILNDAMYLFGQLFELVKGIFGTDMSGWFAQVGKSIGGIFRIAIEELLHLLDLTIVGFKELKLTFDFLTGKKSLEAMNFEKSSLEKDLSSRGEKRRSEQGRAWGEVKENYVPALTMGLVGNNNNNKKESNATYNLNLSGVKDPEKAAPDLVKKLQLDAKKAGN